MTKIPGLEKFPGLIYEISTTTDGNLSYFFNGTAFDKKTVQKNREKFFNKIGVDINKTVGLWVEGEDRVLIADPNQAGISMTDKEHAVRCDSLITNERGLFLFLLVADCLPVTLYDSKNKAIAIVHVGWKGAHLEIVKKTLQKMKEEFGTNAANVIVGFGPSARKDSFIKVNPSQKDDLRWKDFLMPVGEDKYKVDISGFCKKQLIECGVAGENIFDCNIDTVVDSNYFSHHRQHKLPHSKQGRFACVIGLK